MRLVPPSAAHLRRLMTWFDTEETLRTWGGPDVRFPFDERTFEEDMKLDELAAFVLLGDRGAMLGFGRLYERLGRAHLARLAVPPFLRGQGIGRLLVEEMARKGRELFQATENSLFVYRHNTVAWHCYRKAGFVETVYPEEEAFYAETLYMVRKESRDKGEKEHGWKR